MGPLSAIANGSRVGASVYGVPRTVRRVASPRPGGGVNAIVTAVSPTGSTWIVVSPVPVSLTTM
jgi:hypothetical protein